MKSANRRDIIAVGAILLGLFGMYIISVHSSAMAPAGTSSAETSSADSTDQDAGANDSQSQTLPFTVTPAENSPVAPDFTLKSLNGQTVTLSDAVKHGPVVLDFWATWCKPCMYELGEQFKINAAYRSKGVIIYAINTDANAAQLKHFFSKEQLPYTVLIDSDGSAQQAYNVSGLPTVCIIDRNMHLRTAEDGADENVVEDMGHALDTVLSGG